MFVYVWSELYNVHEEIIRDTFFNNRNSYDCKSFDLIFIFMIIFCPLTGTIVMVDTCVRAFDCIDVKADIYPVVRETSAQTILIKEIY